MGAMDVDELRGQITCLLTRQGGAAQCAAPSGLSATTSALTTSRSPPFPYTEDTQGPGGRYWMWFRRAFGQRLRTAIQLSGQPVANAEASLVKMPAVDGLQQSCQAIGLLLSENEVRHLKLAPISAEWLKGVLKGA